MTMPFSGFAGRRRYVQCLAAKSVAVVLYNFLTPGFPSWGAFLLVRRINHVNYLKYFVLFACMTINSLAFALNVPETGWLPQEEEIFSIHKVIPVGSNRVTFWAKSDCYDFLGEGGRKRHSLSFAKFVEFDCQPEKITITSFINNVKNKTGWIWPTDIPQNNRVRSYSSFEKMVYADYPLGPELWNIGQDACRELFKKKNHSLHKD